MAIATIGKVLGKAGLAYLKKNKSKIKKELDSPESKQKIQEIMDKAKKGLGKKMLTGGQAKIAAKAPPPNKIDEKDFAVLRKEKAKGRGMGLQDEKVQPGKVMKANKGKLGEAKDYKKYLKGLKKTTSEVRGAKLNSPAYNITTYDQKSYEKAGGKGKAVFKDYKGLGIKNEDQYFKEKNASKFMKRRKKLAGSKLPGRIGTALGAVSMLVPAAYAAAKQYKDYKSAKNRDEAKVKKMGGGMMKKYSKGGGHYDDKNKNVVKHIRVKKKMGGGMIAQSQRPGYSKGTMVKARGCKLGRTRPTKIT